MRLLVIGGTQFLGKHLARMAVERGHEVTLFNRGNLPAPEGVERTIQGDRNQDLSLLGDGEWDAVVDTCGYFPHQVRASAEALAGKARHYTFVSTVSVYEDQTAAGLDEDAELAQLEDPSTEELRHDTYGALKALCEAEARDRFPGDVLVVRPGLIVGPDDPSDRFTYWPVRVAKGGKMLAPVGPGMPAQWIDVRDLAGWMLDGIGGGLTGTFNATSDPGQFTFGDLLDAALEATGSGATPVWASDEFLLEQKVGPFVELPLWIPGEHINFSLLSNARAKAAGLVARPAADTVTATLEWHAAAPERPWRAGLSAERETELLQALREARTVPTP